MKYSFRLASAAESAWLDGKTKPIPWPMHTDIEFAAFAFVSFLGARPVCVRAKYN